MARRTLVGVIGGSSGSAQVLEAAYRVGLELAKRGQSLLCGGLFGVMEAACRGLHEGRKATGTNVISVGLLPGAEHADANAYVDVAIPTGMGIGRNILVARGADALIAVDGGSGTLSEIAFGWQLGRPIVALATSGGVAAQLAGTALDQRRGDAILSAATPEEAVELAVSALNTALRTNT